MNETIFLELAVGTETLLAHIELMSQKAMWSQGWHDHFSPAHRKAGRADEQIEAERLKRKRQETA